MISKSIQKFKSHNLINFCIHTPNRYMIDLVLTEEYVKITYNSTRKFIAQGTVNAILKNRNKQINRNKNSIILHMTNIPLRTMLKPNEYTEVIETDGNISINSACDKRGLCLATKLNITRNSSLYQRLSQLTLQG